MTRTFLPIEVREPELTGAPTLPFDHTDGEHFVARGEDGMLYHSPICRNFVRYGWCSHLNNARAKAEHPRTAFAHLAHSLAIVGVEEGRTLQAIASDIVSLAFEQESRERFLEEWTRRQEATPEEREARAMDALRRHSEVR